VGKQRQNVDLEAAKRMIQILFKFYVDPTDKLIARPYYRLEHQSPLELLFEALREATTPEKVGHIVYMIGLLLDGGANVTGTAKQMTVGAVTKLDGCESL